VRAVKRLKDVSQGMPGGIEEIFLAETDN